MDEAASAEFPWPTGRHVWRQIGMAGSDYDECVLCGANTEGLGKPASENSFLPCERKVAWRTYGGGRTVLRVERT